MKSLLPLFFLPLFASCSAVSDAYLRADEATYRAVAPDYARYLTADPNLTPLDRSAALTTLDLWRARIAAAKSK
jgi:hypothetical protein